MSRITFDGKGVPIPDLALPPFGGESDIPPTVLTFTESIEFSVADYRTLGFTHYEAWCVGGAGGRGGDGSDNHSLLREKATRSVPQDVWNLRRELANYADYWEQYAKQNSTLNQFDYWRYRPPLLNRVYVAARAPAPGQPRWDTDSSLYLEAPAGDFKRYLEITGDHGFRLREERETGLYEPWITWGETGITYLQLFEMANPSHLMEVTTWKGALLIPEIQGMGGGGGGGGLHKVTGSLDEFPDLVPIVVGKAGADAGYSQTKQLGPWTPEPTTSDRSFYSGVNGSTPYDVRVAELEAFFRDYLYGYPEPKTTFPGNPVKGQDGGASSFADVAQASGGKGGEPGMVWDGTKFVVKGHGGAGGIGGQLEAGGGAAGSVAESVNGADGTWLPETGIGKGGGGGKGGRPSNLVYVPPPGTPSSTQSPLATAGGQGSYSFSDTSVYGQRQFRQPWTYLKPVISYPSETVSFVPTVDTANLVTAGGGGGARPFPTVKVGSRAVGYSPNGVVILRLVKIT